MRYILPISATILGVTILSVCVMQDRKESEFLWKKNQQMILVLSSDWNANHGVLLKFQYKQHQWVTVGKPFSVSLGKNGAAWGVGLHPLVHKGIIKTEGDMRSPAGVFKIGYSFGYAQQSKSNYPYKALTKDDYCIDNSQSAYYNQIVNYQKTSFDLSKDSSEPMRRDLHLNGDQLYKLGFVLNYNPDNISKMGSCIFVHLRKKENAITAGCTAMNEQNMIELLNWLNIKYDPVFVLLPIEVYQQKKTIWNLPIVTFY